MTDPDDWSWVKIKKWTPPLTSTGGQATCDCQLSQALDKHHQTEVTYLRQIIAELANNLLNSKDYDCAPPEDRQ
jgi:hypothetical protein